MDKQVKAILSNGHFNKKQVTTDLKDFISNRCFHILGPYYHFMYKNKLKTTTIDNLSSVIFMKVELGIKNASKAKTPEDFLNEIMMPVNYAKEVKDYVSKKMQFLEFEEEEEPKLLDFKEASEQIFDKYFKRKRKKYVRKNKQRKS